MLLPIILLYSREIFSAPARKGCEDAWSQVPAGLTAQPELKPTLLGLDRYVGQQRPGCTGSVQLFQSSGIQYS